MNRGGRQWIVPAALVAVLFFGCGKDPGEKLYAKALAEWDAGNLVRARTLLEKSISRRPGSSANANANNRLGLLLWDMGERESAAAAFTESIRVDAEQHAVLCNLGVALSAINDFAGAESAFREASLLKPDDPRPLAYSGLVYVQNSKWQDAERNLKRALEQSPGDPKLQTALALTEMHTLDPQAAITHLQTIIRKHPDYAPALFNMASIYQYRLRRPVEAKVWYSHYLDSSSGIDAFSAFARARLQALNGPITTPELSYTPPTARDRKAAQPHFQAALKAQRAGETDIAIREYIRTLEKDDSYELAFYNLGLAYYSGGQYALAGKAFAKALQLNPAYVDARYNLALVNHYHLGNTALALRELDALLKQQPDYQPAMDLLGRIKSR